MKAHQAAEKIVAAAKKGNLNEADTRHQIIDRILHEVLGWPQESVSCEKSVSTGYLDYCLRDRAQRTVLVIEAKREGESFSLPLKITKSPDKIQRVRLRTLVTNAEIKAAVTQAVGYCPQVGSEYACVTNGHSYIIFRSFIRGKDYLDADALVIPSIEFFSKSFTEAINLLGYDAITKDRSLARSFETKRANSRDFYFPKNAIGHYDEAMTRNAYAKFFNPLAKRYFNDIGPEESTLMQHCYVYAQGSPAVEIELKAHLSDRLTPFFAGDGGEEISQNRSGGSFAQRIAASIATKKSDVVILYGGKGAGKSTFLRRLFYFNPPPNFQLYAFPIVVDFLQAPQNPESISLYVWERIVGALNHEGLLDGDIDEIASLFSDRLTIAKKQDLAAYPEDSTEYKIERNKLLLKWRGEKQYVAKRLQLHWAGRQKGIVIAFDNTDQLTPQLQDHCFLVAQNIARELACVTVISMREERYCRARTSGVLDAYHNSGYHLAAPDLLLVFTKRLKFAVYELSNEQESGNHHLLPEQAPFDKIIQFFNQCLRQFRDPDNALALFLRECSRDNTRLALDFFQQFLTSGYTHVEEMIQHPTWTVIRHQVIKPMMIPERYNYDENKSLIPNVFQCRDVAGGSHFTGLRLLKMLRRGLQKTPEKGGFWKVSTLFDHFDSVFGMGKEFEIWADVFLRHGIIEANNRLDAFSVPAIIDGELVDIYVDEVRITSFGVYLFDYLCRTFAYVELTSLDCGLNNESLYNEFCVLAANELKLGVGGNRYERLQSRLTRVNKFFTYLRDEEEREVAEFLLSDDDRILPEMEAELLRDLERVDRSAKRNVRAPE